MCSKSVTQTGGGGAVRAKSAIGNVLDQGYRALASIGPQQEVRQDTKGLDLWAQMLEQQHSDSDSSWPVAADESQILGLEGVLQVPGFYGKTQHLEVRARKFSLRFS